MYRYPVQFPNGNIVLYKSEEAAESNARLHGGKLLDRVWRGSQPEPEPPVKNSTRKPKDEGEGGSDGNAPVE